MTPEEYKELAAFEERMLSALVDLKAMLDKKEAPTNDQQPPPQRQRPDIHPNAPIPAAVEVLKDWAAANGLTKDDWAGLCMGLQLPQYLDKWTEQHLMQLNNAIVAEVDQRMGQ